MLTGIGFSDRKNPIQAGREAANRACAHCGQPSLTFLFIAGDYDPAAVLIGVQSVIDSSNLVGGSTHGIITRRGVHTSGIGVCCLAGPKIHALSYLKEYYQAENGGNSDKIKIGPLLRRANGTPGTAFVFPNGFGDNISALLRELHDVIGPGYQYVGGGTGDNLGRSQSYQITDEGVATDGFALALVHGVDFKTDLAHGWLPLGELMQVTKAEGKRVYELDGMPAFSRYASSLGGMEPADFARISMRHPLGIPGGGGRFLIRDPLRVEADGSIVFVTEIPPNTVAVMMKPSVEEDLSHDARKTLFGTLSSVPEPKLMLIMDCVSRYYLLGDSFEQKIVYDLKLIDPAVSVLGALSFGEISSVSGAPLFYNKSITVAVGG